MTVPGSSIWTPVAGPVGTPNIPFARTWIVPLLLKLADPPR